MVVAESSSQLVLTALKYVKHLTVCNIYICDALTRQPENCHNCRFSTLNNINLKVFVHFTIFEKALKVYLQVNLHFE